MSDIEIIRRREQGRADKNTEIERKWLMDGYPNLPYTQELLQTQGYLSFEPATVRIRKTQAAQGETYNTIPQIKSVNPCGSFSPSPRCHHLQSTKDCCVAAPCEVKKSRASLSRFLFGEWYHLTIKGDGGLARTEVELELSAQQYEALLPLLVAPTAQKRLRTYVLPDGHIVECSLVDEGQPEAFYYAEVEFESEEAAARFVPPAWFGREVTGQPGHSMAAYCRAKK